MVDIEVLKTMTPIKEEIADLPDAGGEVPLNNVYYVDGQYYEVYNILYHATYGYNWSNASEPFAVTPVNVITTTYKAI